MSLGLQGKLLSIPNCGRCWKLVEKISAYMENDIFYIRVSCCGKTEVHTFPPTVFQRARGFYFQNATVLKKGASIEQYSV